MNDVAAEGVKSIRTETGHDRHRFEIFYRHEDEIISEIQATGFYDRYIFAQLDAAPSRFKLGPGSVCIDVGANLGLYSLYLARQVGPTGKVIAFEGSRETSDLLKLNATANGLKNIIVENRILADSERQMAEVVSAGSGQSEFQAAEDGAFRSVTLDGYAGAMDRVDFLKIDINGPDFAVLLAGQQMLSRCKPVILIEFVPTEIDPQTMGASFKLLRDFGYLPMFFRGHWYSALEICSYPVLVGLYQLWRAHSPGTWMNLVFVPPK